MQIGVDRIDLVDARRWSPRPAQAVASFLQRRELLERLRIGAAELPVVGEHGDGRRLVALRRFDVGEERVGARVPHVFGIQHPRASRLPSALRPVLALAEQIDHRLQVTAPFVEVVGDGADLAVLPLQELAVEFLGRHAERLLNYGGVDSTLAKACTMSTSASAPHRIWMKSQIRAAWKYETSTWPGYSW